MAGESGLTPQALYRACIKEAAAQGRWLMERSVRRAVLDMPPFAHAAPDVVERNLVQEAARVLMKHEQALVAAYPQALLAEFAHAIAGDARKAGAVKFDALELMGDEQVQERVELARMQQSVRGAVEAELGELNALVCAVQGLKHVQEDRNPLRPEVYVRSLHTVLQQSPVSAAVRRRWMTHLGMALGPELAQAFRELILKLRGHGVTEAGFQVVPDTGPVPRPDTRSALNVRELRELLSGNDAAYSDAPSEFSATMPAALDAIRDPRQAQQLMHRLRERRAEGAEAGQALRDTVHAEATPAQAIALEVVQLMVDNVVGDTRLLRPVRDAVRELEPALLRLAVADPRFFSDRQHPARQLLDEMTRRSLAWSSADTPGFQAFITPLREAVEALLETRLPGAEPFDYALQTLLDAWGEAEQRDQRQREKAVKALLRAEQRNLLAGKIAGQLRGRPDLAGAPVELARFITGPWAQVMAQARLQDGSGAADPEGYEALLPDLVWSAQPALARANTARLAKMVPMLVDKLRRGLASIDFPESSVVKILAWLEDLHAQALRARDASALADEAGPHGQGEAEEEDSWLAPLEARDSGFVQTQQTQPPQPLFQATQPGFGETLPQGQELPDPALDSIGLQPGAWVEIFDGAWTRWQLTWASPHGTFYLFTHADGKTQSLTRRLLQKMVASGAVRVVATQNVVDGALDAVADRALRNSADTKR